jgi:hypothetical protein
MRTNLIINISEIEDLFKNYCKNNKIKFSKDKFKKFLSFLEIDFYDWIRENLRQFGK